MKMPSVWCHVCQLELQSVPYPSFLEMANATEVFQEFTIDSWNHASIVIDYESPYNYRIHYTLPDC